MIHYIPDAAEHGVTTQQTLYPSGRIKISQELVGGVANGAYTKYFPDGITVCQRKQFTDGVVNGNIETFNKDGGHVTVTPHVNGRVQGIKHDYHADGRTVKHATAYHDGVKQGMASAYRADGTLEKTTCFNDDLQEGDTREYHADGVALKSLTRYLGGDPVGLALHYYSDGGLEKEQTYVQGRLIEEKSYHPGGAPAAFRQYRGDNPAKSVNLPVGAQISLADNGAFTEEKWVEKGAVHDIGAVRTVLRDYLATKRDLLHCLSPAEEIILTQLARPDDAAPTP